MRKVARWAPALGWAATLLFLGSRSGDQLPSGGLWSQPGLDKVLHAAAYGLLGYLAVRAVPAGRGRRALLVGAVAGLLLGVADEWIQSLTPGRHADGADLLADLLGAAAGGWLRFRTRAARDRSTV